MLYSLLKYYTLFIKCCNFSNQEGLSNSQKPVLNLETTVSWLIRMESLSSYRRIQFSAGAIFQQNILACAFNIDEIGSNIEYCGHNFSGVQTEYPLMACVWLDRHVDLNVLSIKAAFVSAADRLTNYSPSIPFPPCLVSIHHKCLQAI